MRSGRCVDIVGGIGERVGRARGIGILRWERGGLGDFWRRSGVHVIGANLPMFPRLENEYKHQA
jgi:hypothetical protein